MDLKGKYDSIQAAGMEPYADMGRALIENLNLYGLGVQPKSDIEALFFHLLETVISVRARCNVKTYSKI